MNYFELFELPVSLEVDKQLLSKRYFELQKKFHPDFHTQSDEDEQVNALEQSADINKALKVLQQPDLTIKYVLQQKGLLEEEEKYQLPPEFLMDMMDLNEQLEEKNEEDSRTEILELEQSLYNEVSGIIKNYREGTTTEEELLKVKEYYFKKKYLQRILDRLSD